MSEKKELRSVQAKSLLMMFPNTSSLYVESISRAVKEREATCLFSEVVYRTHSPTATH